MSEIGDEARRLCAQAPPIPRLCTIKEIAAEAGVGTTTVHRVIHGEPGVSRESHQRVLAVIRRLNAERLERVADWIDRP